MKDEDSYQSSTEVALEIFSHTHTGVCRVIRELWTLLQDMCQIVSGSGSLFFSSCEQITLNGPSELMEFPKSCFKETSL